MRMRTWPKAGAAGVGAILSVAAGCTTTLTAGANDAQLAARGMIERHPHPSLGEVVFHGNPLRFAGAEPRERALAPDLGQHNAEVYAELGLSEAELAQLAENGVS